MNTSDNTYLVSSEKVNPRHKNCWNGVVIFHWQVSYSEAREKCANKNMSLLSTETPAEKDALVALFGENFIEIKKFTLI